MKRVIRFGLFLFFAVLILPSTIANASNAEVSQNRAVPSPLAASHSANSEAVAASIFRNFANLTGNG
ncbi:MAG: hypothetical protein ACE5OZ_08165 [Candidatus Heimdallarchaeota archaeon]